MSHRLAFVLLLFGSAATADAPAAPPATASCKTYGSGKCCEPTVAAHLVKEVVYSACGESEATFLGEAGSKDTCRYYFKVEGEKVEDTYVQVYAPEQKTVPTEPGDPFFVWGKVGKVFYTEKGASPKSQSMLAGSTGLWKAGSNYFVAVYASTKVCTKAEAKRLAPRMK